MTPLEFLNANTNDHLLTSDRERSQITTRQENPNMATPGLAGLAFWGGATLLAGAEELGRAIR